MDSSKRRRRALRQALLDSYDDDFLFEAATTALLIEGEDSEESQPGGSVQGHQVLNRERELGHMRLYQDYFSEHPTYGPNYFRRRLVRQYYILVCFLVNTVL